MGVVFRRGPSKQVLLVSWNLETDTFIFGQWFKGRVYEDRSDLSPSGDLLLYFAADQRRPYSTWTAISRPPYLTALALWPKGDTRGGGGVFEDQTSIALDHGDDEMALADGFTLPHWLRVQPFQHRDWTLDQSVWGTRLKRDGWQLTSAPGGLREERDRGVLARWDPPQVWEKRHPLGRSILRMTHTEMTTTRAWYVADYDLLDGSSIERLGKIEWADWDRSGDLLFAMSGALYRLRQDRGVFPPLEHAQVIADFSELSFERREPSVEAKCWPVR